MEILQERRRTPNTDLASLAMTPPATLIIDDETGRQSHQS
jgi:hypothetical protein